MEPSDTADSRPEASTELIDHIQSVMERQKALLARELHDELGGLLVGAVMDVAWAEQHLSAPPTELKQKLARARQTLASAIDLKRKLIEDLRPTLLDNVGLFAALRWHVQATCKRLGLKCQVQIPDEERRFQPNFPIALFRIVQEALAVIVAAKPAARVEFRVAIDGPALVIEIRSGSSEAPSSPATQDEAHFLAAIDHRIASLGGSFDHQRDADGTIDVVARFPLDSTLLPG